MPPEGKRSITVSKDVYENLKRTKEASHNTWDGFLSSLIDQDEDEAGPVKAELTPASIEDLKNELPGAVAAKIVERLR